MADENTPDPMNEGFDEVALGGTDEVPPGEAPPGEEEGPPGFLRDLSEEEAYNRLSQIPEFPNHISALESRLTGNLGTLSERLQGLEKSLPTQSALNTDKLKAVLEDYDPKLAEALVPALQEALQTSPLDENTLRPHLEPVQNSMQEWMGEQLVLSAYPPEALAEIIPPVRDGRFAPEGQRHKDFVDWYSQQGYQTQQALLSFGAPYVHALRKFEQWEQARNQERQKAAETKSQRLAGGRVPSGQPRKTGQQGPNTPEEAFLAAFEEAQSEVSR